MQRVQEMRVLPRTASHGLTAVLSLLLLFSNSIACWAQLTHPMSEEKCCAQGACKRMPARSSCQTDAVNPEQFVPPVVSTAQVTLVAGSMVGFDLDIPAVRIAPTPHPIEYSPPDLFLIHSSFLI